MARVLISIDNREVEAEEGETVLQVALRNDIFIPHLCYRSEPEEPFAGCRLCFVEVEGKERPVTSCTEAVQDGMRVRTDTDLVKRLQRSALRLLLSAHRIQCKMCHANRRCQLQQLARALNVRFKIAGLRDLSTSESLDTTLGTVVYDKSKCILCGRCVRCASEHGEGAFHFVQRGFQTRIAVFPPSGDREPLERCWEECPVGALFPAKGS